VSTPSYTFCTYFRSSASWRVRIALAWKGIAYRSEPVHLLRGGGEQKMAPYLALNPMGEVPALRVTTDAGEVVLTQSVAILEYLEEAHPERPLLPRDLVARAQVRALVECVNSGVHPIQNLKVLQHLEEGLGLPSEARPAWAAHWIAKGFIGIEAMLGRTAGAYAFGDDVTLADCLLVPQVYNAHRFGVDMAAFPIIARVTASASALAPFVSAHPDRQPDAPPPAG
jgi:maleylacetoacetate isomerase